MRRSGSFASPPSRPPGESSRSSRSTKSKVPRRDERDSRDSRDLEDGGRRTSRSTFTKRCVRSMRRRHCYIILLVGSVVVNMVQLIAFFVSRPSNGAQPATLRERARSSYRKLLGAITSIGSHGDRPIDAAGPSIAPLPIAGGHHMGPQLQPHAPSVRHHLLPPTPPMPPMPLPIRHPKYRIAFTVPWIGKTFPSWFPYFLSSCRRSTFLADWLIFHEDASMPDPEEVPPNVIFHNVGKDGLGRLFGQRIAEALGIYESTLQERLVQLFQIAFREFAYIVTEYKPTHGTVFSDYLTPYSHWSYTDIDMLIGDLPLHISSDELSNFDIFTYHFGDVFRLYLRGQFACHLNSPKVNLLWAQCPHLGSGLVKELETKLQIVRRLAAEGKHGRTRFISAEGCYSHVVASPQHQLRVKFASKAFADWSDDREFYVVDGAVRKCPRPSLVWSSSGTQQKAADTEANENTRVLSSSAEALGGGDAANALNCTPFGPRIHQHSIALPGVQRPHGEARPISIHSECSRWVEEKYRLCADLTEEESPFYNVVLSNGSWVAQRFANEEPSGCLEGAFLHLQRWKGEYKRLSYGGRGMTKLKGRRLFKLSRFGVFPFDATYNDEHGADMAALREAPQEKDLTELDDSEFEKQLDNLRSAVRETREEGGSRHRRHRPRT